MIKSIQKKTNNVTKQSIANKVHTKPLDQSVIDNMSVMNSIANPLKSDNPLEDKLSASLMESINPRDAVEAMLASQMVAVHNQITLLAIRSGVEAKSGFNGKLACNNALSRLANVYTRQMEALVAYRGKSNHQKITVEQVNLNNHGQAVVGTVHSGGK